MLHVAASPCLGIKVGHFTHVCVRRILIEEEGFRGSWFWRQLKMVTWRLYIDKLEDVSHNLYSGEKIVRLSFYSQHL